MSNPNNNTSDGKKQADKPTSFQGDLQHLPNELASLIARPNWLLWSWEKTLKGKWTKVPYQPNGRYAKNNDPTTWNSYDVVIAALGSGKFDGIGYCLAEDAAFDIDDCRNPETGEIDFWALELVKRTGSYAEITVSGTGLRYWIWQWSRLQRKLPVHNGVSVEVYRNTERYIVITGNPLGEAKDIINIDEHLDAVVAELEAKKAQDSVEYKPGSPEDGGHHARHDEDDDRHRLPFAWNTYAPNLLAKGPDALMKLAEREANKMREDFGVDLVAIMLDTMGLAACYENEDKSAQVLKVMSGLGRLSDVTGALVINVDHLGKDPEAGLRGASAKRDAVETVLMCLVDLEKDIPTNRRLQLHKIRDGDAGRIIPYKLKSVPMDVDEDGDPVSTCVIEWEPNREEPQKRKGRPRKVDVVLERVIKEVGLPGKMEVMRAAFKSYHGGSDHAANQAWNRAINAAGLIVVEDCFGFSRRTSKMSPGVGWSGWCSSWEHKKLICAFCAWVSQAQKAQMPRGMCLLCLPQHGLLKCSEREIFGAPDGPS